VITRQTTLRLTPPPCVCGVSMVPALWNVTLDVTKPECTVVWRCPMETYGGRHGADIAEESK